MTTTTNATAILPKGTYLRGIGTAHWGHDTVTTHVTFANIMGLFDWTPWNKSLGLNVLNPGKQRQLDLKRVVNLARSIEQNLNFGKYEEFAPFTCTAALGHVEEKADGIHILKPLNIVDVNHRRAAMEYALTNADDFPLFCDFLNNTTRVLTILVENPNGEGQFDRIEQDMWHNYNTNGKQLSISAQKCHLLRHALRQLEEGSEDWFTSMSELVIGLTLDQITDTGPLAGRIDMDGSEPGNYRGKPVVFTEWHRTLESSYLSLVTSGDIIADSSESGINDQVAIFKMVILNWWGAIYSRWNQEFDQAKRGFDTKKWSVKKNQFLFDESIDSILVCKKGIKSINQTLTPFLRWCRLYKPFENKFGVLDLKDIFNQPLDFLFDATHSMLSHTPLNEEFWAIGGGHQRYDNSTKGTMRLAHDLWTNMKPAHKTGQLWHMHWPKPLPEELVAAAAKKAAAKRAAKKKKNAA